MTPFVRLMTAGAAAAVLLTLGVPAAHADGSEPTPLRAADRAAATRAAGSDSGLDLARRVATLERGQTAPHTGAGRVPAAGGATPRVVAGTTTEVHVLARDFVAEGTGPVGDLGYVATTARVDEQLVSVWTTRTKGGAWRAVNAATGDVEASMARRAGSAALLSEPQVGAWYAVTNDRVRPLNGEARKVVGGGMSLEDYQQVVHERYADKLPGSDYDESGAAGGFEPASAPVTTPGDDAPPRSGVLAGIGGIGLLAAGLLVRRRRSHT